MKNYDFLLLEREHGHLDELMHRGYLNVNLYTKMEAYAYHQAHPKASTWEVAKERLIKEKEAKRKLTKKAAAAVALYL